MAAGDPDLRLYGAGGRLLLVEFKGEKGKPTASQKSRHPLLARLGHPVTILQAATEQDAADQAQALVQGWLALAANDNRPVIAQKRAVGG
jgi:hypothetical protein